MEPARTVGREIFPLDEQLGLERAGVAPRGQEALVRLAAWMSFKQASASLRDLLGIQVSATSSWRYTYQAGQAAEALQQAEETRIREDLPEPPKGAECQAISADGAFVPLVAGEWAEVKTLVGASVIQNEQAEGSTTQVSSFSRLADAQTFSQQAIVELHRQGTERAEAVYAVTDGAEWTQGFIDDHCPTALRILDFAHAAEYVSAMGQLATEAGSVLAPNWLEQQLHELKHEGPKAVLAHLRLLQAQHPDVALLSEKLAYLEKRGPRCTISPISRQAGRLGPAWWKVHCLTKIFRHLPHKLSSLPFFRWPYNTFFSAFITSDLAANGELGGRQRDDRCEAEEVAVVAPDREPS